jgi:micrococcal nuclease
MTKKALLLTVLLVAIGATIVCFLSIGMIVSPLPTTVPITVQEEPSAPDVDDLPETDERTAAYVKRVVDGDTIDVLIDGEEYKVRYIGINAPESVRPEHPVEWMGPEASEANHALVTGKTVHLETDISDTDRFGRLLRYVYVDDLFVNGELVRLGYARARRYPPDLAHQDLLTEMEQEARAARRGLWGEKPQSLQ